MKYTYIHMYTYGSIFNENHLRLIIPKKLRNTKSLIVNDLQINKKQLYFKLSSNVNAWTRFFVFSHTGMWLSFKHRHNWKDPVCQAREDNLILNNPELILAMKLMSGCQVYLLSWECISGMIVYMKEADDLSTWRCIYHIYHFFPFLGRQIQIFSI